MNVKASYILPAFLFFTFSCSERNGSAVDHAERGPAEKEGQLQVDYRKDDIALGTVVPAKGKWIDPDSVAKPRTIPIQGKLKVVPVHSNVYPEGKPEMKPVPKKLTVISPGKAGVPMPDVVPAQGKIVPASQPPAVPALPLRMKDVVKSDIQYLDVDQGMNSSYVSSIMEDGQGNLWFGTFGEGVSRYDGANFTHYTTAEGLSHNSVVSILEDSKGNMWFGTFGGGVSRYDGANFTHYTTAEGLSHNSVVSVLEDSKGNMWFGTFGGGVSRYDGANFTHYTTAEGLSHNSVGSVLEDSKGNMWFGTQGGGVSRYDGVSFAHYTTAEGLSHNWVVSMLEDGKGNLWFGTQGGGVSRYDGINFTHYTTAEGLSHNWVWSILEDSKGNLWFGTNAGGVNRYDPEPNGGRGNFTHYTTAEGLNHNSIRSILEDSQGNMWFGTFGGGVSRYDGDSFIHYTTTEGLSENWAWTMLEGIKSILEDGQGALWLGTGGGGVRRYDPNANRGRGSFTHYTTAEGLIDSWVWSILEDSQGNLWFGTGLGVNRYDPNANEGRGSFTYFTTAEGLSQNSVRSILEDSQGALWFGTFSGGVNRYDPGPNGGQGNFTHYTTTEGLSHNSVRSILEDSQGNLWFGTGLGVSRYDPTANGGQGSFTHYTTAEGLSHNSVRSILEDSQGNLWFGTEGGGLSCYVPSANGGQGSFTHVTAAEGLNHNSVLSMLEDSQGRLWISTEKGITLLILTNRGAPMESNSEVGEYSEGMPLRQIFTFGKEDGLKRLDFVPNSACLDRHGRIWWGSLDGLTMLDLDQFEVPAEPPKSVQLTYIEMEGQFVDYRRLADTAYRNKFPFGKELALSFDSVVVFHNYPATMNSPHHLDHFTFHFSAIDWAAPHKIQYSYLMEGLDEKWSSPSSEPKADFRHLPFGAYTFKLKAIGAGQVWSEPFQYTFTIRPPWWFTWWAYTLYFLVLAGLLYALYRFLLNRQLEQTEARRLKELDIFKSRFYTNITHEFRTPLTVILGMADKQLADPDGWLSKGADMIKRNGQNLLRLVNQMLDLAKLESGSLPVNKVQGDIIQYLRCVTESFQSFAESKDISLHFLVEEEQYVMDYDPEKLLNIVSNLLSNAIKFTPADGNIYFKVAETTWNKMPFLQIKVQDTGIGIPANQLSHIFSRFYQVDTSAIRKNEGTGIGLALTKELVHLLGGAIEVNSKVGEGATFNVFLPAVKGATTVMAPVDFSALEEEVLLFTGEAVEEAPKGAWPQLAGANKPLLLIVEDNRDVTQYLFACLEPSYQLLTSENGQIGIERAIEMVPDIIISDVMMPEKDGLELCDTLKNEEKTSHIPIVLLTAKADVQSKIAGLKKGADAYLPKPFAKAELLAQLENLVEQRKKLQLRYQGTLPKPAPENTDVDLEDAFLQKIRALVEEHLLHADFDINWLAHKAGMSRIQLFRKIKALTGRSPSIFVRSIRLRKAKNLLLTSRLNISEIAYDTGFGDPAIFSRVFREEFGQSPTEMREGINQPKL